MATPLDSTEYMQERLCLLSRVEKRLEWRLVSPSAHSSLIMTWFKNDIPVKMKNPLLRVRFMNTVHKFSYSHMIEGCMDMKMNV